MLNARVWCCMGRCRCPEKSTSLAFHLPEAPPSHCELPNMLTHQSKAAKSSLAGSKPQLSGGSNVGVTPRAKSPYIPNVHGRKRQITVQESPSRSYPWTLSHEINFKFSLSLAVGSQGQQKEWPMLSDLLSFPSKTLNDMVHSPPPDSKKYHLLDHSRGAPPLPITRPAPRLGLPLSNTALLVPFST